MADVTLPQLGETVTEGTITKWFKAVGDSVALDEPLFEVSTDKVDTEVPSPIAGTVMEIRVNEGDTVPVGAVIAVVGDGAGGAAEPAATSEAPVAAEAPAGAAGAANAEAEASGDGAAAPAPQASRRRPRLRHRRPRHPRLRLLPSRPPPRRRRRPRPRLLPAAPAADEAASGGDNRLLSPVVRRLVNEHGLDPAAIEGTGTGGRITREDVLAHIDKTGSRAEPAAAPAPGRPGRCSGACSRRGSGARARSGRGRRAARGEAGHCAERARGRAGERDESVRLSKIRQLTGDHMIMSKAVTPHAFSVVEVDYANVDRTRSAIKREWKASEGFSLTYLPFICRALVDALAEFPHLNASVGQKELIVHRYIDLGIAVDLDYQGLLVPVVRDADTKRLRAIAREISDLAARAKARKLSPDEIQGGTFTVSNNGSAGSVLTAPIINQPQVAILSTDAIVRRPVAVALPDGSEGIAVHPVGNLAMSWDHRAFDGAYAANFLLRIKTVLETRDWEAEL